MDSKKKKIKIFRRSQHLSLIPIAPTPALVGRATWLRKVAGEGVVTETERKGRGRRGSTRCKIRHEPLLIGHSVSVCALEDRWRGEERGRGEFISAHDATRRAKMKADGRLRGRLPWFRGPNRVQRTGAILASYLFPFDVTRRGNEVGPHRLLTPCREDNWLFLCFWNWREREREERDGIPVSPNIKSFLPTF